MGIVGKEAPKVGTASGMVHLPCILIDSPLLCVGSGDFTGAEETKTIGLQWKHCSLCCLQGDLG